MGLFTTSINTLTIKFVKSIRVTALSTSITMLALSTLWVSQPAYATQYSPNFKGTDINEFINIVGKILKKTIIIDPTVRGKVNVRSYDLLSEKQYYQFFLNVLEVYGYAVVDMGNGILKVVKAKDAKNSAIPVVGDDAPGVGDEMVTRVVEVKNVSVRELSPLLRQFSNQSGSGHVVHYDPSNVIMMTGSAATVNRLVDIINRVDRAGDLKVEIVKLQFASASEIVRILESIYSAKGNKDQPEFLIPKIVSDDRTNSVIVSGEPQARSRVIKLIERLDAELESAGNTRVHYLKYAKAEEIVKVLTGVSDSLAADAKGGTSTKTSSRSQKRDYSIQAHADSNSLVINAEPDMMRSLEQIIRQLDIRRQQVLVEAIIVEVYESEGINLGVQWGSEDLGFTQFNNGAVTPVSSIAGAAYNARDTTTQSIVNGFDDDGNTTQNVVESTTEGDYTTLASVLSGMSGFATGIIKDGWGAVIQAVSNDTNSNVLATPSITTLDNEEASILVGSEVPILTGSSVGSDNSNPFQTVERTEVGIKLSVTPQINEGSAVQLLIEQEVSSISGATGVDLGINKRSIKTTVLAEDGATIVIGGLIDEDVQESVSKVPLLGDIPYLGHLFKSTSTTKRKRNLMVFIRAVIIRENDTLVGESRRKYNYIRAEQLKSDDDGIALMPFTSQPVLKKWDETIALPPSFEEYLNEKQPDTLQKLQGTEATDKKSDELDNESKGNN
ncbi:type II secretion system protein GspD [Psychrosphaera saromensis]|uniref:Type II secretion system protein GspD n=2 Tax=Psychrosphaera saromensis TaxID=716813 RepID=A0A2S7USI6_9GAMM|nr:type II secretion system protein GspD [Psychrosphaera saromensis]GHB77956.1 type II secretion system protein GspD [Psychrosphaera saromensis]GLQ12932.1 type II secretion system protein GspD [Psychrosphaera saromensis]